MKQLVAALCALSMLSACGGGKSVREEPAKLQEFAAQLRVKEMWTADSGASAAKLAVTLSPALDGDVI